MKNPNSLLLYWLAAASFAPHPAAATLRNPSNRQLQSDPPNRRSGDRQNRRPDNEAIFGTGGENVTAAWESGVRFNKFKILDGASSIQNVLPLTQESYPFSNLAMADLIRDETSGISVFYPPDCDECQGDPRLRPENLLIASNVTLTHPSTDENSPFWLELWEVMQAQIERVRNPGDILSWMELPETWVGFDMVDVAEAVHDEYPGSHHVELLKALFGGALDKLDEPNCPSCANIDREIIPMTSSVEFIRGAVMLADLNTWAFGTIGPINFSVKWHFGRARPEEVIWKIFTGKLVDGVPGYILDSVQNDFMLNDATDFTAYDEGSPEHPSFPAMHAASSAASLWIAVVMDLTPEQHCRVKALDYAIAYARTIAGVHYPSDNIAGLNIGQEILAVKLPGYLSEKYGSSRRAVEEKIARVRFDWNDYFFSECFM